MKSRLFIASLFYGSLAFAGSAAAQQNEATSARPNILVIMADDLGWFDLHCQGNAHLDTPHLDRLATQGVRFTDGYAASPVCTPTRAAMMTGQSPARLAITNHAPGHKDGTVPEGRKLAGADWQRHLPLATVTIAERLRDEAGYATGFVGKWHLSHHPGKDPQTGERHEILLRPEHQGFDFNAGGCDRGGPPSYFEPYRIPALEPRKAGEYLPERLADECIGFLERTLEKNRDAETSRPFFLSFWNYSVHYPIEAPADLIEKYKQRGDVEDPAYAAMIEGMDRSIGRVLKALDDLGIADDTLVIFTSDNGSLFGNGPLRANKGHLYEGGIRVPWIIRWPGHVEADRLCHVPVISTDVVPTLMKVSGLELDPETPLDGESLLPLLTGKGALDRDAIFFHYPNYAFHKRNRLGSTMREGNLKLILWHDEVDNKASVELYDVDQDIGEKNDLAARMPEKTAEMRAKLETWLEESGAKLPSAPKR